MRVCSILILLLVLALLCGGCRPKPQALSSHGQLRVGELVPGIGGVTDTGELFNSRDAWTSLTIYSVADTHPPFSVDMGKAVPSLRAQRLGARLIRTSDGKIAKRFGVNVVYGKKFRYDTSLVVLCDTNQRVLRIWKSASVEDLDELIEQFETERTVSASK